MCLLIAAVSVLPSNMLQQYYQQIHCCLANGRLFCWAMYLHIIWSHILSLSLSLSSQTRYYKQSRLDDHLLHDVQNQLFTIVWRIMVLHLKLFASPHYIIHPDLKIIFHHCYITAFVMYLRIWRVNNEGP